MPRETEMPARRYSRATTRRHDPRPPRWPWIAILAVVLASLGRPQTASAHPLGNFTVNRYSRLDIGAARLSLVYIVDMAEIPTFQERAKIDLDHNGQLSQAEQDGYLEGQVTSLTRNLALRIGGDAVPWSVTDRQLEFPEGQAGLPTLRITLHAHAPLPADSADSSVERDQSDQRRTIDQNDQNDSDDQGGEFGEYSDGNYAGRLGWQEVVVRSDPTVRLVSATAPDRDTSQELRKYPTDLLQSPLAVSSASFRFVTARESSSSQANGALAAGASRANLPGLVSKERSDAPPTSPHAVFDSGGREKEGFARLISTPFVGPGALLLVLLAAFGWGAAHALTPGHGKTIAAAYLVGTRGTVRHALFLGLTTTVTHTAGVFLLGFVTLFASRYILPEQLYPWLGVLSGLVVVALGLLLLRSRLRPASMLVTPHDHGHDHEGDHVHDHADDHDHAHVHLQAHDDYHGHPHLHKHDHVHDHVHDHDQDHPRLHDHDHAHHHSHDGDHHHTHSHLPPGADGSAVTWRSLLALGISGGLLPCPSALVVMLGAIALNKIGLGLVLITCFSLGLASVLTLIGVLLVRSRHLLDRVPMTGRLWRLAPALSAVFITLAGLVITYQALLQTGLVHVLAASR